MSDKQKLTLDRPVTYQIKVPGHLANSWSGLAGNITLTIKQETEIFPITTLTATVDQAGLHSLLRRLYALGLPLISVNWIEFSSEDSSG